MKKKYGVLAVIAIVLVAIDQITKMYVHTHFQLGESVPIINGYFNITYVRNFGAAFGFLAQSHPSFREIFFLIMPPAALLIILLILRTVRDDDRWQIFALSCVFGGAIGNYIDRIRFQYVIDFLDFHIEHKYSWPSFNVADSAIVTGVCLLLVLMFLEGRTKENATTDTAHN